MMQRSASMMDTREDLVESPADTLLISQIQMRGLPAPDDAELELALLRADDPEPVSTVALIRAPSADPDEPPSARGDGPLSVGLDVGALVESAAQLRLSLRTRGSEPRELATASLTGIDLGSGMHEGALEVSFGRAATPAAAEPEAGAKGGKGAKGAPKGGKASKAPVEEPKPDAAAPAGGGGGLVLAGWWRLEAALGSLEGQRVPQLALQYFSPAARQTHLARQALWREEMRIELGLPSTGWTASHRHAPAGPAKPSHLLGDAPSREARLEYVREMNSLRVAMSEQAVQRQCAALFDTLSACVTAEQAAAALDALGAFLRLGANLSKVDAAAELDRLANVRLPFERLVRNVWMEGPEVAYDQAKASIRALLTRELAARRAEQRRGEAGTAKFGPLPRVPTYVHDVVA